MISPTCGSWIGARTCRVTRHGWVVTGRPAACCGAAAGVGAAVEAPAGGALVDLAGAVGDRLAQPVGVAAGVLHLVGVRRPVDAAVGHPAGRQPGAAALAELRDAGSPPPAASREHLLEVDVLRRAARAGRRGRSRSPARARRRATPRSGSAVAVGAVTCAGIALSPAFAGPARLARRRSGWAARSGSPTIRRYSRAASSSRSSSPSGIHTTLAYRSSSASEVVVAEHRSPQLAKPVEVGGVDDPVVGAGLQVDGRAGGEVPGQRPTGGGQVDHLLDERGQDHVDRPRPAARGGRTGRARSRVGTRARRGPPSAAPRAAAGRPASCRSAGSSDSESSMSCSIAQRLVCLAWKRLVQRDAEAPQDRPPLELPRRRSPRASRAASLSRGRRCGSGSRCARGPTGPGPISAHTGYSRCRIAVQWSERSW